LIAEKFLSKAFDIREGEGRRASLMWAYIFLVISSLMIVKPVSNAMFLSNLGASRLPFVFILVAISAAAIASLYARLLKKIHLIDLIVRTLQIVVACLFIFWCFILFRRLAGWVLYVFYVWVAIFAVISASQFWILANIIFNAREAKRLFGFIGAGAISGGIFGGYLTNFLAPLIGSENLLFVCMGFLSLCIPITKTVWRENHRNGAATPPPQQQQSLESTGDHPFKLLKDYRHLAFLAGIVGISVVVARLVEYQFSAIASAKITDEDQLAAFFGFWFSNLNIASLLIQLFVTRRVVGVFGVGTSLFFLPVGILLGALAILIDPALWSAVLIKISDGSLKQSINKAGMELLALPLPVEIKNQAKSFIDVFVDSFATGIGGLLLLFLTLGLGFSVRHLSVVIILLLGAWVYVITRVRQEYLHSFRLKIERQRTKSAKAPVDFKNESVFGGLINVLQSADESQILQVLKMVKEVQSDRLLPCFKKLIGHPAVSIRLEVLRNVYFYKQGDFTEEAEKLVHDHDQKLKTEALRYLFQHTAANRQVEMLEEYLQHEDYLIRGAALLCAAGECRNNKELKSAFRIKERVEETLKPQRQSDDEERTKFAKLNSVKVLGVANIPELYGYLHILLRDQNLEVKQAALASAGQTAQPQFIPVLLRFLLDSKLSPYVRQALASFGAEIITILAHFMNDVREADEIRLSIPKVIAAIGGQKAADVLIKNLDQQDLSLRHEIIKALNRLRANFPELDFGEHHIVKWIVNEARDCVNTLAVLHIQMNNQAVATSPAPESGGGAPEKEARRRLIKALEERADSNLERIFRLLGLKYPPDDIYNAFVSIRSDQADIRVNAVEFLDNLLDPDLKKVIIPLVETRLVNTLIDEAIAQFDIKIPSEFDCLVELLSGNDDWLKACTLNLIGYIKDDRYLPYIGTLINSPDPMVQQTAAFALRKLGIFENTAAS